MHTCYLELKLSIIAAGLVAQYLSCKTRPAELGVLEIRRKWSLEQLLLPLSWGCNDSKRGFCRNWSFSVVPKLD